MYGHPSNPDPWSERQEIPPYDPDDDPTGFVSGLLLIALPVFVLAFALGYSASALGWLP